MSKIIKKKAPWISISICCLIITLYFLFIFFSKNTGTSELYSDLGAPFAIQIYQGQYWGVLLNNFLHADLLHLLTNTIGLIIFGTFIERRTKPLYFILLVLFASISTSTLQLTLSNDAGIGLTGANSFFSTFIFARSFRDESFKGTLNNILLLAIIIGIIVLNITQSKLLNIIGLESIYTGLALGVIIGATFWSRIKLFPFFLSLSILTLLSTTLFYAPWSAEWNYFKGYEAHEKGNYKEAKIYYKKALTINPNHIVSKENLHYIQIDELSEKAMKAHQKEDYVRARKLYNKLLLIDPNNSWAKANIAKLP